MIDPVFEKFAKFAQKNCCNYSASGPNGKVDFCWLEPRATQSKCYPVYGKRGCKWFEDAVLPLDKDLQAEWYLNAGIDPDELLGNHKVCECGERFQPTSSRNVRCPDCTRIREKEMARSRKRKQRGIGVTV